MSTEYLNGRLCLLEKKENHAISKKISVDHYILLLKHLSNQIHFITNGYKCFSKTNLTDPRQRVPLIDRTLYLCTEKES